MNNIKEKSSEIKFNNSFEIDQYILGECKKNKRYLSSQSLFIKQFNNLYENNNIIIRDYHLQYLYKKYKDKCFPNTLDQIYDYCKKISDSFVEIVQKYLYSIKKKNYSIMNILYFLLMII